MATTKPTGNDNPNRKPAGRSGGRRSGATAAAAASRREQLRLQQEAEAARARRNRLVMALSGVLALAIIAGVITWAVVHHRNQQNAAKAAAVTPPNASGQLGINVTANGTASSASSASSAPQLFEYQDYQCPVCKSYYTQFGKVFNQLVADGKMRLQYRTMTFLDQNENNDASERSAIAAACADTVGAYEKYHDVVYANQPAKEGDGYTDDQLRNTFASQAGITGSNLTTFQKCYDGRATQAFVDAVNTNAEKQLTSTTGQVSTPTFLVDKNGTLTKVDLSSAAATEAGVLAAVNAALGS